MILVQVKGLFACPSSDPGMQWQGEETFYIQISDNDGFSKSYRRHETGYTYEKYYYISDICTASLTLSRLLVPILNLLNPNYRRKLICSKI
jgi:hypothetical protein